MRGVRQAFVRTDDSAAGISPGCLPTKFRDWMERKKSSQGLVWPGWLQRDTKEQSGPQTTKSAHGGANEIQENEVKKKNQSPKSTKG